jgi:hypothetical protein
MILNDEERELVVSYLFESETAFLVELIMDLLPYEDAKRLADSLKDNQA